MKHKFNYIVDWDLSDEKFVEYNKFAIPYFVSNYGRVKRSDGSFLKPMLTENTEGLFVHLRDVNNTNRRYKYRLLSLPALVLDAFQGGYAKNRKVTYKDENKKNCRLSNLEWKYGWNGEIDLSTLNYDELSITDKLYYKYMSSNDMMEIEKIVKRYEGIIKTICHEKRGTTYFEDAKMEIFITLKNIFDGGRYKPERNKMGSLIGVITRIYIRDIKVNNIEYEVFETLNSGNYVDSGDDMY